MVDTANKEQVKCIKCGRPGRREYFEKDGVTYMRIAHTKDDRCYIGRQIGSFSDAVQHFGLDEVIDGWPKTLEQYQAIMDDIVKFSKKLEDPRYGNSRFSLRNHLLAKIPIDSHKSKQKQLDQYDEALRYIIDFVKTLNESNWGHLGKSIRPRLVRMLKSWGVWDQK